MHYTRKKYRGIGLLELTLSLTIIAAILLMATRYYLQASEAAKITQATRIIGTLVNTSFKWLQANENFDNLTDISVLVDADLLPADWSNKKNPWGGAINLSGYGGSSNQSQQQITISLTEISKSACENINDIMKKQGMGMDPASLDADNCTNSSGYIGYYPVSNSSSS